MALGGQHILKETSVLAEVVIVLVHPQHAGAAVTLGGEPVRACLESLDQSVLVDQSVKKFQKFEEILTTEKRRMYKKKELADIEKRKDKLEKNLAGVMKMEKMPGAIFIVDPMKEHLAVHEAQKLGIPIIAIIDTNGNPDGIDYLIPANDDGMRCISLVTSDIVDAYMEGLDIYKQKIATEQKDKKERPARGETRSVAGRKVRVKRIQTAEAEEPEAAEEAAEKE